MTSLQERITGAILKMIRTRREASSTAESDSRAPSRSLGPAKVREAQFSDFHAVAELKQRWGIDADSPENWERLWRRNPALEQGSEERPMGWVLEAEGSIVGYLGNISLLYRYGDRTLCAVTSHGLAVEPGYRAAAISLAAAFFRQGSVDLYLDTTATPAVGRIAKAFKADALPQAEYETALFWVVRPYAFARVLMEKLRFGPVLERIGRLSTSFAVRIDKLLNRRWPRESSTDLTVHDIAVNQIGDDFQALWIEKLNERWQLLADRSPATLRWHFEIPGDRGSATVLCCRRNGKLHGYAVIRNDPQPNGLQKSLVADLLARQDDPEVVRALLVAAYGHAKRKGSYALEMLGFPASIRRVCLQWHPYSRKYPACPFYYKAADPVLHKALSDGGAWYASPFDGDTTLIRPSFASPFPPFDASGVQIDSSKNAASNVPGSKQRGILTL
jgi:hypothetical protein